MNTLATNHDEVRQRRDALKTEQRDLLDAADAHHEHPGRLTAEQQQRFDDIQAQIEELDKPAPRLTPPDSGSKIKTPRISVGEDRSFESMFGVQLSAGGFADDREFFRCVHEGLHHPGLESATMLESGDSGYLVPTQFSARLIDSALEQEVVRPRADVEPMRSNHALVPVWDDFDRGNSKIGGFGGEWLTEGAEATNEAADFASISLNAEKLAIFASASSEVVADGFDFENRLMRAMGAAIAWHLDDAFLTGDGVGKPLGVLNSPSLITVAKEGGQGAATLTYSNLTKIYARVHPSSLRDCVWVANPTTVPQLMVAFATDGNIGSNAPVLRESGNGTFTIFGRPVVFTEKVPELGDTGDIALVDFRRYLIGLRQEITLERSISPGWQTDTVAFRIKLRAAGQAKWKAPVTPKKGNTLSWAVTLSERS